MTYFWLGTHMPNWVERTNAPLFLSARRLRTRRVCPALGPVAIDSGGFSELSLYGRWETPAMQYATEVRQWMQTLGTVKWAAVQDWMCEPFLLEKTRLTVREHQRLTVHSTLLLRQLAPDLPWAPVLQGWRAGDYLAHAQQYADAGIDLAAEKVVGVGSVCRRQSTYEAVEIFGALHGAGLRNLHGFGVKLQGLRKCSPYLASADSMAWSLNARKHPPLPGCTHRSCANCLRWAVRWRERVLRVIGLPKQGRLFV